MFRFLPSAALAAAFLLPGCAGSPPADPAPGADHPGNPEATTAPLPPRTETLAATPAAPSAVSHTHAGPGGNEPMVPLPGEAAAGAGGHSGRAGMDHGKPSDPVVAGPWTCPMHPDVHAAEPGKCPICGMKLVKKDGEQ